MKAPVVALVHQLASGAFVICPQPGRAIALNTFATTQRQADGSFIVQPVADDISMREAGRILGLPYTTLRRIVGTGRLKARKSSPGKWVLSRENVLAFKQATETNPDFWGEN